MKRLRSRANLVIRPIPAFLAGGLFACSTSSSPPPALLTSSERIDPASCASCHAEHYAQWSGSMHAHAADDPLFVAMNKRAQRETGGAIGNLCVRCHAPVAVATGATTNGLDLPQLPAAVQGVTCYFCHSVDAVNGASDNPLHLASDGVFRAGIADPVSTPAHASAYSPLHDRDVATSAPLCGACHDVALTNGLAIEQTFVEWGSSVYAQTGSLVTCGKCHMAGTQGVAASPPNVVPMRTVHDHSVAAVDLALDSPDAATQAALTQAMLDPALTATLCVNPSANGSNGNTVTVTLDDSVVGHDFPSGAVHDRRAWVELVASAGGAIVFESGVVPNDQTSVQSIGDPNLWLLDEALFDASQSPVLFMWEAASAVNVSLPVALTNDPTSPLFDHAVTRGYPVPAGVDHVKMRVRLAPVALEVVASLVASGDLDPSYEAKLPVYTLAGTVLEWTAASADAGGCVP
ncbi:MAG: multiheme c-type cytochrome [Polyangiaceae bacterium]|jgi:hypothetical protein